MLVIRETQLAAFKQTAIHSFENRIFDHLKKFFPRHCQILGPEQVLKVIRLGLERAKQHDFDSERNVHLYVGLMVMLGSHFDQDPQLTWATNILADENISNPNIRADRLHNRAITFLNQVAGKDNEFLERALLNAHKLPISALSRSGDDRQIRFEDYVLKLLYTLFPEKLEAVGDPITRQLISQGDQTARGYHLTGEQGIAFHIILMFLLGAGFDNDPQYPWATTVLNDASLTDPVQKADLLYQEAKAHLEKWLAFK